MRKYILILLLFTFGYSKSDASSPINYFKIYKEDIPSLILVVILIFIIILLFINIKRRKQLEEELEVKNKLSLLQQEFNSFFELSINLQLISDIEGKIIKINNVVKNMFGYEREELINTSFMNLVHPDDIESTINEMKKLQNGEPVYYFENRYRHKNGTYIDLAWSSIKNKTTNLIYATAQDITNTKLVEADRKKKERLLYHQSKLVAMGEMIGNIAHHWRQPLSIISTAATGTKIQKEMNILSDEEIIKNMDIINNSAQNLSSIIEDFRNFFNPSNNIRVEFFIPVTIEKTLKIVSSQFVSNDIEIIKDIKDISIISTENELIQVLLNILNNAIDTLINTKKQKRFIFINIYEKDKYLILEIKDNGNGIPLNIIDRIFEPYFSTKYKSQGTGIGLYMSEEILRTHLDGTIQAENISYRYDGIAYSGAKFTIKIAKG